MIINTKFNIGDTVYFIVADDVNIAEKCAECDGAGVIKGKLREHQCSQCLGEGEIATEKFSVKLVDVGKVTYIATMHESGHFKLVKSKIKYSVDGEQYHSFVEEDYVFNAKEEADDRFAELRKDISNA